MFLYNKIVGLIRRKTFTHTHTHTHTHIPVQNCCINNERPTGQKQQLLGWKTVENIGKLILTEIFPSVQKHDI